MIRTNLFDEVFFEGVGFGAVELDLGGREHAVLLELLEGLGCLLSVGENLLNLRQSPRLLLPSRLSVDAMLLATVFLPV